MSKEKLSIEIYRDLLSPSVQEIGDILRNSVKVTRFAFAGIDYLAAKERRWQLFLENVASKVNDEDLTEAPAQITGQIIEGMLYEDNDTIISEMFANLLSNAISKKNQNKAHPAFAKIIQQLSYDEAVIMYYLSKQSYLLEQKWDLINNKIENMRTIKDDFPLDKINNKEHMWMYMDHLNSLTIAGTWKTQNDEPIIVNNQQIGGIVKSERKLTDFGKLFCDACVPKNIEDLFN